MFKRFDIIGKWHLGWDSYWKNDHSHGPLNHGFSSFFGLPFTLVDGLEMESAPFLTYSGYVERDHPMPRHGTAAVRALLALCALHRKEFGYSLLVSLDPHLLLPWFDLTPILHFF